MNDALEDRLAAWIDDALSPEDRAAFEAELEADPELAARAASWRANDAFISAALAPLAAQKLPPEMLERMGLAAPAAPAGANDNAPWWRRHATPIGGALAASLVAALLLVLVQPGQHRRDEVSLALDTTPALGQAKLADGRVIEPLLTVKAADGRWCREFRDGGAVSLACRQDGRWTVEATGQGSGPVPTHEFGLADGGDGSSLDGAYRRLGASDPVSPAQEAALIAGAWTDR